ncbi:hypothetical protein MRB53_034901 [Persea americana]|uniref:Uncharacterized protein n=1 Tax=Persea americana TaxID=3435 RepID=A0ACC2K373_PERAE|nr:hypothetical protein MRB53_034901 [Persea americana]
MSLQIQMTSTKFSYHRLKNPGDVDVREEEREERSWRGRSNRKRSWWRLRRGWIRRPRIRIPRLRRFSRRKSRKLSASWIKIWKRLKESRSYIGDLFAGNYLLMQQQQLLLTARFSGNSSGHCVWSYGQHTPLHQPPYYRLPCHLESRPARLLVLPSGQAACPATRQRPSSMPSYLAARQLVLPSGQVAASHPTTITVVLIVASHVQVATGPYCGAHEIILWGCF